MSHGSAPPARRRGWLVAVLVVAALLGGCQARPPAGPPPSTEAAGQHQPPTLRFAGQKPTRTNPFLLAGGLTVFTGEHRGGGRFSVQVLNKDGEPQRVLFLASGRYRGSTGLGLGGGIYRLAISASTPWTVEVIQPRGRPGAALPQRYRGAGDGLVGPFHVDRNLRVDAEHDGQGDVTVELLSAQGPSLYFLVEETGRFKVSKTAADLEPGDYYLNIEADGTWRLALSEPANDGAGSR
jgi:hypothetical protein